jgi:HEAT repeat protein
MAVLLGLFVSVAAGIGAIVMRFVAVARGAKRRFRIWGPWLGLQLFGAVILFSPLVLHTVAKKAGWFRPEPDKGGGIVKGPGADGGDKVKDADKKPPADKELPKFVKRPLKQTGDAALDQTLADLAGADSKRFKAATDRLLGMAPNEHRAIVAQHLVQHLAEAPVYNRTVLVQVLGRWGTAEEVPALLPLLADANYNLRNETLKTLGSLKDERAAVPMVRCLLDLNTQFHAENALKAMGPAAEGAVLDVLKGNKVQDKIVAIRILAEIGTAQSVPALEAATKNVTLQSEAKKALAAVQARIK